MNKKEHIEPWKIDLSRYPKDFLDGLSGFCGALLSTLNGLESAMRQFHPPNLPKIQAALRPFEQRLKAARIIFEQDILSSGTDRVTDQLLKVTAAADRCLDYFLGAEQPQTAIGQIMKAMRQLYRAQEYLYPLIEGLKPVGRYFLEAPLRDRLADYKTPLQDSSKAGLYLSQGDETTGEYCFYVPETYTANSAWPLVVALHGGSGSGRDFIWLWLREARSRRFLLAAPSSAGRTWSFDSPVDAKGISAMIDTLSEKWRVDRTRILLTGCSDGAIYTLTCGIQKNSPFTALAPISGVLHPIDLTFAKQKRIYLVHGTLDWMFSIQYAHQSLARLKTAGAEVEFRELTDLSHTYPREENDAILSWFDPALSIGKKHSL